MRMIINGSVVVHGSYELYHYLLRKKNPSDADVAFVLLLARIGVRV